MVKTLTYTPALRLTDTSAANKPTSRDLAHVQSSDVPTYDPRRPLIKIVSSPAAGHRPDDVTHAVVKDTAARQRGGIDQWSVRRVYGMYVKRDK